MKIIVLPSWYPSAADPVAGVFIQDQAQVLSSVFDVAVVAPSVAWAGKGRQRGRAPENANPAVAVRGEEGQPAVIRPQAPTLFPRSAGAGIAAWKAAARTGIEELISDRGRPDLIHAHVSLPAGWAAVEIGRELDMPVVLTEHLSPFDPLATMPKRLAEVRAALTRSAAVIAVSPHLRSQMLSFQPGLDIDVVGNVIRTDVFTLEPAVEWAADTTVFRFLAVGSLTEQKGFGSLIEAIRLLVGDGFRGAVTVVGDGPLRAELQQAAAGLPVSFAGMLDRAGILEQMALCHAFVAPSLHESFGVAAAEALACGRPVISTRCGGPEFVVETGQGTLVQPGSVDELASAMAAAARGELEADAAALRASVESRFGPAAFLDAVGSMYRRVLGGGA